MNTILKRILSVSLVICMLLALVPLNATESFDNGGGIFSEKFLESSEIEIQEESKQNDEESLLENLESVISVLNDDGTDYQTALEQQNYGMIENTNEDNEINLNNFEISLQIKDVTKNSDWSDSVSWEPQYYTDKKVITYQISYENNNPQQDYLPGELKITIPKFEKLLNSQNYIYFLTSDKFRITIDADNNSTEEKRKDWSYQSDNDNYIFTNNKIISGDSPFNGSIQLTYSIEAECLFKNTNIEMQAILNDALLSNTTNFSFNADNRTGIATIKPKKLNYTQKYSKDYIYILYEYCLDTYGDKNTGHFPILYNSIRLDLSLPTGCKIYDENLNELQKIDGYYPLNLKREMNYKYYSWYYNAIIAYPISVYKDTIIDSDIEFSAIHADVMYGHGTEYDINEIYPVANTSIKVNTSEFEFNYNSSSGGFIAKYNYNSSYDRYKHNSLDYTNITQECEYAQWVINAGTEGIDKCSVRIGDDFIMAQNINGEYVQLSDDEYYISSITLKALRNIDGNYYERDVIDIDVYVRYKNQNKYKLYQSFKNVPSNQNKSLYLESENVVGFYIDYKNLPNGLYAMKEHLDGTILEVGTIFKKSDIANNSRIYNFSYIQVFDENGSIINTPDLSSYNDACVINNIPQKDIDNYGNYLQRGSSYYNIEDLKKELHVNDNTGHLNQYPSEEKFATIYRGSIVPYRTGETTFPSNLQKFETYTWFPDGVEIDGDVSFKDPNYHYSEIKHGNEYFSSSNELLNFINSHAKVEKMLINQKVVLKILYDFTDEPLNLGEIIKYYGNNMSSTPLIYFTVPIKVSYDNYLLYGSNYTIQTYLFPIDNNLKASYKDNFDANNNGETEDYYSSVARKNITIISAISTQQDVQTSVMTDKTDMQYLSTTTEPIETSLDSEYTYRLRVRTGANNIKNLIIYDNLEQSDKNNSWKGQFIGIDTSVAENKTYLISKPNDSNANSSGYVTERIIVKTWYSENPEADKLYENDDSINSDWKEYGETVDKSKVKSLAFEYLTNSFDGGIQPAIIPNNSATYVYINMKSPSDEGITSYAYNKCWTEWSPIDITTMRPVEEIKGIASKYVRLSLPNSVENKTININFNKIIDNEDKGFDRFGINKNNNYNFFISLENQETRNVINGLLNTKSGLVINNIEPGTYIINENQSIWFSLANIALNESIEGIDFSESNGNYVIIISASVEAGTTANIDITNKCDDERFYDNKHDVKNLFNPTT